MKKRYFNVLALILLLSYIGNVQGQTSAYYPKGDPDKWNVEITPFLWLPAVSGEVGSMLLSENSLGNSIGLNMIMYGFDLGIRYNIPKRNRDKSVFKKVKQNN